MVCFWWYFRFKFIFVFISVFSVLVVYVFGKEVVLIRILESIWYGEVCRLFVLSGMGVDRCFVLLNVWVKVVIKIFK